MVPWARRAEAERRATASAMRRVARILRDNCARIVAEPRERDGSRQTKRLSMVERPKRLSPPGSRRPAAARSRVPSSRRASGRRTPACPTPRGRPSPETAVARMGELRRRVGIASRPPPPELTRSISRGTRRRGLRRRAPRASRAARVFAVSARSPSSRGREDERRPSRRARDEEDEEDEDETVSASLRAFDECCPPLDASGRAPLVVVLAERGGAPDW